MEKFGSFEVVDLTAEAGQEARQELATQQGLWLESYKGMPAERLIKGFVVISNLAETIRAEEIKGQDQQLAA